MGISFHLRNQLPIKGIYNRRYSGEITRFVGYSSSHRRFILSSASVESRLYTTQIIHGACMQRHYCDCTVSIMLRKFKESRDSIILTISKPESSSNLRNSLSVLILPF
jgi:hypothetical protein